MTEDVIEVEPGIYSILVDGQSFEVRLDGDSVWIDGESFGFEHADPRQWKRSAGAAGTSGRALIVAPMPGKIVRVLCAPGESVDSGQGIVVVEAMKMQNELKAPRPGRISAINVKEGDSVNAGEVLAVLE